MNGKILVTDSLFIFDEHVKKLEAAGYEVERLDKPAATEEELCQAVKGKVGYILGGIEKITDKVIESADELKAIAVTATAAEGFVPGMKLATERGIAVANAPHANADSVAEWAFAAGMAMVRNLFALGRTGDKKFSTTNSLSDLQVGIVGLGHVGERLADLFAGAGAKRVVYWNRSSKSNNYKSLELKEVLSTSDIVCICMSRDAGKNWLDADKLSLLKDGAIITSLTDVLVDEDALLRELSDGRIRAYLDWAPKNEGFKNLPLDIFYCSNESSAYNTKAANKRASDMATESLLNMLAGHEDKHQVN